MNTEVEEIIIRTNLPSEGLYILKGELVTHGYFLVVICTVVLAIYTPNDIFNPQ